MKKIICLISITSIFLLLSCAEDESSNDSIDCSSETILNVSDFYFTGENGEKGISGTFSKVYLTSTSLVLEEGQAGSNAIRASIDIDLETLINSGNTSFDLSFYKGRLTNIGDATYSTLYNPRNSASFAGGSLTLTHVNSECKIVSGSYEINGGRFNSQLNRDLRLGIKGDFDLISIVN